MKIKIFNGILITDILTVLVILAIAFIPLNVIRIILGLPFLLYFPGYTLVSALFLKKDGVSGIERIALGFGMSIAVTALIGLGLNYTPWGIRLYPVLISISVFILVMSAVALIRRARILDERNMTMEINLKVPGWSGSVFNKTLTVILAVAIVVAVGVLGFAVVNPKVGEKFTEFYILGSGGKAELYPSIFVLQNNTVTSVRYGETGSPVPDHFGKITLGIINHEQKSSNYVVTITIDGQPAGINYDGTGVERLDQIVLQPDQKWEKVIGFAPQHIGANQKVEFSLFKDGADVAENTLHIWVTANAR